MSVFHPHDSLEVAVGQGKSSGGRLNAQEGRGREATSTSLLRKVAVATALHVLHVIQDAARLPPASSPHWRISRSWSKREV